MGRRVVIGAVVAAGSIGAAIEWRQPLLPDSSWLLWIARRWLDGATLYRDVFDINPPLAIWLDAAVVLIARAAAMPVADVFRATVLLWCCGCIALLDAVLRYARLEGVSRELVVIAAAIVLLALPGPFFGQREHLILATALPWAALLACRRQGAHLPAPLAASTAVLVSMGIALKPTYAGLWIALPLLSWRRFWWRFPETWVVPAVGMTYVGLVAGLTSYFDYVREWGPLYWRLRHVSLLRAAFGNELTLLGVGACALAWPFRHRPLTAALLTATAACLMGAVLQGKEFPYHYWPADGLALVLLASSARLTRYALIPAAMVWIARVAQFGWDAGSMMRRQMAELESRLGDRRPLILDRTNGPGWLLVNEAGKPWLSPFYDVAWLQVSHGLTIVPGLPRWATQDSVLRQRLLPTTPPEAILIDSQGTDIERWLSRSADWARLLSQYRSVGSAAGYRILFRVAR
jgi:hypothetical protein